MTKKDLNFKRIETMIWELVNISINYKNFKDIKVKVQNLLSFIGPELKD